MVKPIKGFTLIELLLVVAIIGILAALAFPSYEEAMKKSRRADGRAALLDIQIAQEKYRQSCAQYATSIAGSYDCNSGGSGTYSLVGSSTSMEGYYALSITAANATTYTLSADPQSAQAGDTDCDPMTLDQNGGGSPTACW